jgi:hypothetical protein
LQQQGVTLAAIGTGLVGLFLCCTIVALDISKHHIINGIEHNIRFPAAPLRALQSFAGLFFCNDQAITFHGFTTLCGMDIILHFQVNRFFFWGIDQLGGCLAEVREQTSTSVYHQRFLFF